LPALLAFYLVTLGCGLASLIFTGIFWAACAALGGDAALGPRPLAVFILVCFAIHLAVGLVLFAQQKNRWKEASQSANTLISMLFLAVRVIRFCIQIFARSRHSAG
jgi:succinate dehydrogenase/fumarate reductase cytochrome b subunit